MGIKTQPYKTHDAMAQAVADRIIALVRTKPDAVIGLATGSTPEAVYAKLVEAFEAAKDSDAPLDFSQVTFFALDEYVNLPLHHPESYHYYLWSKLLGPIDADPAKVHIPHGTAENLDEACQRYEAALAKAGGVDLWIVGMGHNGHIAFNEPGTPRDSRTHVVPLTDATRQANARFFGGEKQNTPSHALTVGLGTLKEHAKEVAFMVNGEAKAGMLARVLHGGFNAKIPATLLQGMNVTGYFDEAALSQTRQK